MNRYEINYIDNKKSGTIQITADSGKEAHKKFKDSDKWACVIVSIIPMGANDE